MHLCMYVRVCVYVCMYVLVCICVVCVYSLSHSLDNIHMQIATIGPRPSEDVQTSGLIVSVCLSASQTAS